MPRFITIPYAPDRFTRWEVLEQVRLHNEEREFHLRRRGGFGNPEGAEIIATLTAEYPELKGLIGQISPMAGDIAVLFKKAGVAPIAPKPRFPRRND